MVSISTRLHLINIYRSRFGMATSTAGSVDPMEAFGVVSGWLHDAGTSAVSGFVFLCWINADALNFQSSVFAPRLPWHPGFEGKFIEPY